MNAIFRNSLLAIAVAGSLSLVACKSDEYDGLLGAHAGPGAVRDDAAVAAGCEHAATCAGTACAADRYTSAAADTLTARDACVTSRAASAAFFVRGAWPVRMRAGVAPSTSRGADG